MWQSIISQYGTKSTITAINARAVLESTKLTEGEDLNQHLQKMWSLWKKANDEGAQIEEQTYCIILVSSLPIIYFLVIRNVLAAPNINEAEVILINWKETYDRMGGTITGIFPVPSSATTTVLAANSNTGQSQLLCSNCKRRGHLAKDCYWPGGGKEGQFPPNFSRHGRGGGGSSSSNSNILSANAAKVFALATNTVTDSKCNHHNLLNLAATDYCFTSWEDFDQYSDMKDCEGEATIEDSRFKITGQGVVSKSFSVNGQLVVLKFNNTIHTWNSHWTWSLLVNYVMLVIK